MELEVESPHLPEKGALPLTIEHKLGVVFTVTR